MKRHITIGVALLVSIALGQKIEGRIAGRAAAAPARKQIEKHNLEEGYTDARSLVRAVQTAYDAASRGEKRPLVDGLRLVLQGKDFAKNLGIASDESGEAVGNAWAMLKQDLEAKDKTPVIAEALRELTRQYDVWRVRNRKKAQEAQEVFAAYIPESKIAEEPGLVQEDTEEEQTATATEVEQTQSIKEEQEIVAARLAAEQEAIAQAKREAADQKALTQAKREAADQEARQKAKREAAQQKLREEQERAAEAARRAEEARKAEEARVAAEKEAQERAEQALFADKSAVEAVNIAENELSKPDGIGQTKLLALFKTALERSDLDTLIGIDSGKNSEIKAIAAANAILAISPLENKMLKPFVETAYAMIHNGFKAFLSSISDEKERNFIESVYETTKIMGVGAETVKKAVQKQANFVKPLTEKINNSKKLKAVLGLESSTSAKIIDNLLWFTTGIELITGLNSFVGAAQEYVAVLQKQVQAQKISEQQLDSSREILAKALVKYVEKISDIYGIIGRKKPQDQNIQETKELTSELGNLVRYYDVKASMSNDLPYADIAAAIKEKYKNWLETLSNKTFISQYFGAQKMKPVDHLAFQQLFNSLVPEAYRIAEITVSGEAIQQEEQKQAMIAEEAKAAFDVVSDKEKVKVFCGKHKTLSRIGSELKGKILPAIEKYYGQNSAEYKQVIEALQQGLASYIAQATWSDLDANLSPLATSIDKAKFAGSFSKNAEQTFGSVAGSILSKSVIAKYNSMRESLKSDNEKEAVLKAYITAVS